MIYGSVCSGIEAASVAWHPLGWRAAFLSEIEPFPRAVLQHHYHDVPLHGDFTTIQPGQYEPIELLVGGTPCQSFSVAGLRGGLDDERGNLALEFLRLAHRLRPRWVVWENVPGVLSSNGGRDFGAILGGLAELGYGWAYRVLDAQFFGVPQRRRRVFVVGCLGDWRRAVAVLFERESLSGHPAPRRQTGEGVAPTIGGGPPFSRTGNERSEVGAYILDGQNAAAIDEICGTLQGEGMERQNRGFMVAHSLRAGGFDASGDGTGRGTPLVPVPGFIHPRQCRGSESSNQVGIKPDAEVSDALTSEGPGAVLAPLPFDTTQMTSKANRSHPRAGDPCHPLAAGAHPPAVAFPLLEVGARTGVSTDDPRAGMGIGSSDDPMFTLQAGKQHGIGTGMAVRRLAPRECERLQGFPDDYTLVPYRSKPAADGPRYKALGNSMAVPCMAWIGQRIQMVDALTVPAERAA